MAQYPPLLQLDQPHTSLSAACVATIILATPMAAGAWLALRHLPMQLSAEQGDSPSHPLSEVVSCMGGGGEELAGLLLPLVAE